MATAPQEVTIRSATAEDAHFIAECNRAMALETESLELEPEIVLEGVRTVFAESSLGRYWIAEVAGRPVGGLMVTWEWSDWRNGLFWWIQSVYILPDYRRRGLFRRLYHRVREEARADRRCCGLRLYVERENETAQRTYAALGMHETAYRLFEEEF